MWSYGKKLPNFPSSLLQTSAVRAITLHDLNSSDLLAPVLAADRRVLLVGAPGTGKSTFAADLAHRLLPRDRVPKCIAADPGSPAFGVPGAVALGQWTGEGWRTERLAALCTLDAGRFRLPLVDAVRQLAGTVSTGTLLIDAPGVVRGVAGAELLHGLVRAADIDWVWVFARDPHSAPLFDELVSLGIEISWVAASADAVRPGKRARARRRTEQWSRYLANATEQEWNLDGLAVLGTAPPRSVTSAWLGRQIAVLDGAATVALGEVLRLTGDGRLKVRIAEIATPPRTVLIRDALRNADGLLETAVPFAPESFSTTELPAPVRYDDSLTVSPVVMGQVGSVTVSLVNGVLGDPLLHVRLQHQRRSLLFDLGEGRRLSAKTAHEVSDVFISHAHLDHIGGFLWLLRSRIGELPVCRLYGPPGLAQQIEGFLRGVLWDRVGERAPRFHVTEVHGETLLRFHLEAGKALLAEPSSVVAQKGVVYADADFQVRAVTLDHGTPVLAYAYEPSKQINVRKERLAARGLTPGPWLAQLKSYVLNNVTDAPVTLPTGRREAAGDLAADLILMTEGKRLVYATDFGDTAENRARLIDLARDAHTLFCEASFVEADQGQAQRTGHLTARACGEIAAAAGVARLVPFHFSRRYAHDLSAAYEEITAVYSRVVTNAGLAPARDR